MMMLSWGAFAISLILTGGLSLGLGYLIGYVDGAVAQDRYGETSR